MSHSCRSCILPDTVHQTIYQCSRSDIRQSYCYNASVPLLHNLSHKPDIRCHRNTNQSHNADNTKYLCMRRHNFRSGGTGSVSLRTLNHASQSYSHICSSRLGHTSQINSSYCISFDNGRHSNLASRWYSYPGIW